MRKRKKKDVELKRKLRNNFINQVESDLGIGSINNNGKLVDVTEYGNGRVMLEYDLSNKDDIDKLFGE